MKKSYKYTLPPPTQNPYLMRSAVLATLISIAVAGVAAQTCNEQNQINEFCEDICAPPTNPCDICATYIEPCDICSTATITCGQYCPQGQFANGTKCSDTCKENERMLPFTHQCQACPEGTTRLAGDSKPSKCCTVGYMQTEPGGDCVELTCNFQGRPLLLENFTCGDICPAGTFANHSVCSPHTPCSADQFEIVEATASQDRTCQTIRPPCNFTAGQFQASTPTATTDRTCQSIRTCTEQEFQTAAPTNTSDRGCQNIRTCTEQEFETSQPTATTDRTCQSLTTCSAEEFETIAPTSTSDRSCQSLTTCSAEEYETVAPTATTDRTCQSLTTCTEQEFEASAPTATSDRSCQSLTSPCSEQEFEATAPTSTSDRLCVCKQDHFFNGIHCQACATGTRLQGDSKEGTAQACCVEAFQSEAGAACTPYTLPSACNSNEELIGGTESDDKYCSACPPDKTSENGQACQTFAQKQLQGDAIPTTENTIVSTFRLVNFSLSVKEKKKQMQSMVKFLKEQIRALAKSRIQMTRDELVLSDKFQSKLGNRVNIDVIAAKQKTVAKINSADACEEKDVDLRAQPLAYEVSLEEQEAALVCSGNTPVTKLTMTREGALYGEDTDLFQYACWNGLQWTSAVDTQSDAVYQCDEKNFYVNSLSGVTCNVSDPVSQADQTVTAGNAGTDCGETIGDGDTCSSQCNENFILVQQANCSTDGFQSALCQCPEGHQDNLDGTCTPCTENSYATEPNTLSCTLHSTQNCTAGEFFTQGNAIEADSATCTPCPDGSYQSLLQHTEETCIAYSTTEQECNTIRKTFLAGTSTQDTTCAQLCLPTEYANGTTCYAQTLQCPAGYELLPSNNNYTDNTCQPCAENTYKELSDDSHCTTCSAGNEIFPLDTTSAATGCEPCNVTTEYDHDGVASTGCIETPEHCPAGFQHTLTLDPLLPNLCTYCPDGTYQPNNHSTDACTPYSTTEEECNAIRKTFIQGSSKITDDAKCGITCPNTHYASADQCIAYANTASTCNEANAIVQLGQANHTDDSICIPCYANSETANGQLCTCAIDHFYNGTHCQQCLSGHRVEGDDKTTTTQCCIDAYQNQPQGECIPYSTTEEECNANRQTFIQGNNTHDATCADTCLQTEYASEDSCIPYSTTVEECNDLRRPFIQGNNTHDAACADPCLDTEYAEGDQCIVMACTVTKPVSAIDENIVAGININCPYTVQLGERCEAQCNENYIKVQEGYCTIEGYLPALCLCNITGYHEDGIGNCKTCDPGSFLVNQTTCVPWTVTPEECNQINKPYIGGDSQHDASCGQVCEQEFYAEYNRCVDPLSKIKCGEISWLYDEGLCCENSNNMPSCVHTIERQATNRLHSFGNLKREDGTACQDTDQITYQQGILICT